MKRNGTAVWQGGLKDGKGTLTTDSGVLSETPYSFARRFENEPGTNPEELIAAAHAGCFTMALSGQLAERGLAAENLETRATVTLERIDGKPTIAEIHLALSAKVSPADKAKFEEAAKAAKEGCPVSRLLAPGTKITMDARLA